MSLRILGGASVPHGHEPGEVRGGGVPRQTYPRGGFPAPQSLFSNSAFLSTYSVTCQNPTPLPGLVECDFAGAVCRFSRKRDILSVNTHFQKSRDLSTFRDEFAALSALNFHAKAYSLHMERLN